MTISAVTLPPPNIGGASSSTTIDKDAPSLSTSPKNETTPPLINSKNVEQPPNEEVADFQQPHINTRRWTNDHLLVIIIGNPSKPVSTRCQHATDALWCYFHAFLVKEEPKNCKEAMKKSSWIKAMQEEINKFEPLEV
ncbi:hypothetical protein Tco_0141566 [Tanacetum coccineum]